MDLLFKEIQTTQDVINKIKDMRQGLLGTALVSVMNEVSVCKTKPVKSKYEIVSLGISEKLLLKFWWRKIK